MASNYGPHFGVRRWDEDMAVREGRYKTPATGNPLLLGTAVEIDFAAPGFMKQCGANRPLESGVAGLLIYEDQFLHNMSQAATINAPTRSDTAYLAYAGVGRYAVIGGGAGSKFWFKNLAARTLPDGFQFPALSPVAGLGAAGVALGAFLGWNGTQWATIAPGAGGARPAGAWFRVVTLNDAAATCEVVLLGDGA